MSSRGKVIRPPMEEIARGKVFIPSKHFLIKNWFSGIFSVVMLWVIVIGSTVLVFWFMGVVTGGGLDYVTSTFGPMWFPLNFWYWLITGCFLIPYLIVYPIYIRSFEYSLRAKSGETMPDIHVKKGLLNLTRKHVPFRNITYITSVAGPFDRLFGIGSVEVETAGGSIFTTSAKEKLEGLTFYRELRDFIVLELRKLKDPYVTRSDPVIRIDDSREYEILHVVREIRDLLLREMKFV